MVQQWREPIQLTQGDTINFMRSLAKYPASQGWSLLYAMRGGVQVIEFVSTPVGDSHSVIVPAATTEGWLPANYELEGFAVNAGTGERYSFYNSPLLLTPDLSNEPGSADNRTHAQRMLSYVEAQLELLAQNSLDKTSVEGTEIQRVQRDSLYRLRTKYIRERQSETDRERAKSGLPSRRKIKSVFLITAPGAVGIRNLGAGNSVFNDEFP